MIPSAATRIGRVLRLPLRLVPRNAVLPVLGGVNRGLRWIVGSSVHGCWIGSYERKKQQVVIEVLRPHMHALDIGAQAGFYTLAFARRIESVWAFEPSPFNAANLRFHVEVNRLTNVCVREMAVGDKVGKAAFDAGPNALMGRLAESGALVVPVMTLDALVAQGMRPPDLVKIDVEGAELAVLHGARDLLARRRTIWLVALDDVAKRDLCLQALADYNVREFSPGEIIATPRSS